MKFIIKLLDESGNKISSHKIKTYAFSDALAQACDIFQRSRETEHCVKVTVEEVHQCSH
jgi:hypothetical protein